MKGVRKGEEEEKEGEEEGQHFQEISMQALQLVRAEKEKEVAETVSKRKEGKRKKERKTETKDRRICVSGRKKERCTSRTFFDYSHGRYIYIVFLLVRLAVRLILCSFDSVARAS